MNGELTSHDERFESRLYESINYVTTIDFIRLLLFFFFNITLSHVRRKGKWGEMAYTLEPDLQNAPKNSKTKKSSAKK